MFIFNPKFIEKKDKKQPNADKHYLTVEVASIKRNVKGGKIEKLKTEYYPMPTYKCATDLAWEKCGANHYGWDAETDTFYAAVCSVYTKERHGRDGSKRIDVYFNRSDGSATARPFFEQFVRQEGANHDSDFVQCLLNHYTKEYPER